MVDNKIKIAVSSCLLGEAVRYDGTDKHIDYISQHLAKEYNLISLCPEMAIGMGVPRAPIHLVDDGQTIQVLGVNNAERNVTKPLTLYGKSVFDLYPDICGYIFKKNSPSCGIDKVKVFNTRRGEYERRGQGIYVTAIKTHFPSLPMIDEEACFDNEKIHVFIAKVAEYRNKKINPQ